MPNDYGKISCLLGVNIITLLYKLLQKGFELSLLNICRWH